jgi:hypothetical protein
MLTAAAILVVLLLPVGAVVAMLLGVEAWQRARDGVVARQIMLTDAVHAELGAVVSPVVDKRAFRPWRVTFAVGEGRARELGRLIAITERVLGAELATSEALHIVFTRPVPLERPRAA